MSRSYKLGHRRGDAKYRYGASRLAWMIAQNLKVVINGGISMVETGRDLVLYLPNPGRGGDWSLLLTGLTEAELDAFKDIVNRAIELARPVVRLRDEEAQDAYANGDDSFARVYRQVPQLVYREGSIAEYSKGLHDRPERVPEEDRGTGALDRGVRRNGDGLAEPDEDDSGAQDDGEATD